MIENAIQHVEKGDNVLPSLISMQLKDMLEIFSEKYDKPVLITQIRPGEKMLESLISETQAQRLMKDAAGYYYIKASYKTFKGTEPVINYSSKLNPVSKKQLAVYLIERNLL